MVNIPMMTYRANKLWATRIQVLLLIIFPLSGGDRSLDSCLKFRSFSPRLSRSAFMMMLSKAMVAQALCVVLSERK